MDYIRWIRGKVGRRKLFLVYGSMALRDAHGRILFVQRRDNGLWGLPGGIMELDESVETAARRELFEETGLEAGPVRLTGVQTGPAYDVVYPNGDAVQQFVACFTADVTGGTLRPDPSETLDVQWLTPDAIATRPMAWYYRERVAWAVQAGPPVFNPPQTVAATVDQIADVRQFIGTARYTAPGTSVIVTRDDGRLLLLQRVGEAHWHFPAGYSNLGENVAATAVRELREETGLEIVPQRIVGIYSHPRYRHTYANGDRVRNVGVLFQATAVGGQARVDGVEIAAMAWVLPEDVEMRLEPRLRALARLALAHLHAGTFIS